MVVISAFGRGHWLAREARAQGLSVALVDVSQEMGAWQAEDWEGPFGVFGLGSRSPSHLQRLQEDATLERVEQGFTVWPPGGPLELHSNLTPYLLEGHRLEPQTRQYLEQAGSGERSGLRREIMQRPFESHWLSHFAHQFASTAFVGNAQSLSSGEPLALFSDWTIRRLHKDGVNQALGSLSSHGVQVYVKSKVLDVGVGSGQIDAIEVKSVESGIIRGSQFVWTLSSEDSIRFPAAVKAKLFPSGILESEWTWVRYQLRLEPVAGLHPLPKMFAVLGNVFLPWAHSNLFTMGQSAQDKIWDVWLRLPSQRRFQRPYLEKIAQNVLSTLRNRIPGLECDVHQMPLDYTHNLNDIGAPRFPVFNEQSLKNFKPSFYRNFHFAGPEVWSNLDWSAQFSVHGTILERIRQWCQAENERQSKRRRA